MEIHHLARRAVRMRPNAGERASVWLGFGILLMPRIFAPKNRTIAENLYIYWSGTSPATVDAVRTVTA